MEIKPNRIIWHHTAISFQRLQFAEVDRYHKSRGFPRSSLGFYVGYHYLIEYDGAVRQARVDTEIGAHDAGENYGSIGVCMAGDFTSVYPTDAQAAAAARLCAALVARWNIPNTRIEPHRWGDTTSCPGKKLEDLWFVRNYLSRTIDRLSAEYIALPPAP